MAEAAFFDVDGTLTRTSLLSCLGFYLSSQQTPLHGAKRLAGLLLRSPMLAWSEFMDRGAFNEEVFRAYAGMSEDRLLCLADAAVDQVLMPALFHGARDLVRSSQERGLQCVFISGSPDFLVERLGERLGVERTLCFGNRLEFLRGVCTGRLLPPVLAGPQKANLITRLAQKHAWKLTECFAYSDDSADAPMLGVVGHPAAVNPGPRLKAMARSHRWPVLDLS